MCRYRARQQHHRVTRLKSMNGAAESDHDMAGSTSLFWVHFGSRDIFYLAICVYPLRVAVDAFPAILLSLFAVSVGTEFKCTNSLISDQWREKILTVQNDNRRRLAQGKQKGKDNNMLKPAKNMQELVWDCALEDAAYEAAAACTDPPTAPTMPPAQPGQQGQKCGAVSSMIKAKSKSCDATAVVEKELKDIWKAGAAKQADKTVAADNNAFSQMAYCKTNGVGCSYNWCSGKLYLVCFYNNEATAGDLYEEGDTCSKCPPNDDSSNCFVGLCRVDPTVYAPASKICTDPALANANLMTDELRHEALNMHNYYRRLLATGWAEDKKLKYAKPAAAMPELKYNCEVEDEIMGKLKDCPGAVATITKAQANNFKLFTPYTATRQEALSEVIKHWWSPLASTGIADNQYLDSMAGTDMETYVNMAYAHTTGVGCAVKECDSKGNIQVQCGYVMDE
ncbi:SCP-like protein [Ancylostoma ceylanicum]|uniref:SCP-like protein n=1 Tax=Ancylostoma ceylanicum TaxID=53326 RepID=A0A0D6M7T2_9BILA|nr:SCP-like protein [Ancylostoma ceylanicum]